ncbi:MAG: PilZ domain-containing protein [Phycisphaeraceae bacterium]
MSNYLPFGQRFKQFGASVSGAERRKHRRFQPRAGVESLLGEVIDLSASGMRVFHKGSAAVTAGDDFDILLLHESLELMLPVRVVWVRHLSARRQMIGLEITKVTPEIERVIGEFAPQPSECVGPQAFRTD